MPGKARMPLPCSLPTPQLLPYLHYRGLCPGCRQLQGLLEGAQALPVANALTLLRAC